METFLGLLLILLPVIFKFIGKKFEQSGNSDAAEKLKELAQAMGEDKEEDPFQQWFKNEPEPEVDVEPVVIQEHKPVAPAPVKTSILVEEEKKTKGEKVDPKKLVIYSEIMKPKYTE